MFKSGVLELMSTRAMDTMIAATVIHEERDEIEKSGQDQHEDQGDDLEDD